MKNLVLCTVLFLVLFMAYKSHACEDDLNRDGFHSRSGGKCFSSADYLYGRPIDPGETPGQAAQRDRHHQVNSLAHQVIHGTSVHLKSSDLNTIDADRQISKIAGSHGLSSSELKQAMVEQLNCRDRKK